MSTTSSKYGQVVRSFDSHPRYRLIRGDARDAALMTDALAGCDQLIAGAAMIGGISYFHTYAYDLLATNERILAATCDAAIRAHRDGTLSKVTYLSSSMVFELATSWPSSEGQELEIPPPRSSYGFQKPRSSTSPEPHVASTACRTQSCGRSTALVSVRAAPSATWRSSAATSSWR